MNRTLSYAFLALAAVFGLALQPAALSAQKALVYCPVDFDDSGCNTVVNALTTGGGFPGGVRTAYNGASGTLDLATADLSGYAVMVIPSLADNKPRQPYALLKQTAVATRLSGIFTGRVAVWSGTPDQGANNRDLKNTLIRNLANYGAGDYAASGAPGLVVLQDQSVDGERYAWLVGISGRAIGADPTTKGFAKVRTLDAAGEQVVKNGSGKLAFDNMASYGLVIPAGSNFVVGAVGDEGTTAFNGRTSTGMMGLSLIGVVNWLKDLFSPASLSGTTVLATSSGGGNTKLGSATLGDQSPAQINPGQTAGYDVTATRCTANGCSGNATVTFTFLAGSNWPAAATVNWPLDPTTRIPTTTAEFGAKNKSVRVTLTATTTSNVQPGTYDFIVRVAQGNAKADVPGKLVVVAPTPNNRNPTIQNPGDRNNAEGDPVSLQIIASDPDAGDVLTYGASGLPAGLSINTSTGLISGTVDWLDGRSPDHTVTVTVSDGKGGNASATFKWTISNTNRTPTITRENATATVNEGQTATNTGTYSDLDTGDNVTITASVGTVTKTGTNSGTWSWSFATSDNTQSQTVTITANDGKGGTASTTFSLSVNNVAPIVTAAADQSATAGASTSFNLGSFADPGADSPWAVEVNWGDNSTNTTFNATSAGTLSAQSHTYAASGTYTVTVKVTDKDGGSDSKTFQVSVAKATATVTLSNLTHTYDGTPKAATATTNPAGLNVTITYDGSTTAPTNYKAGGYAVVATINDPAYQGSESGTLTIAKATPAFSGLTSQTITYGTESVTLSGTLAAGTLVPAGSVSITLGTGGAAVTQSATIQTDGSFSSKFITSTLAANTTPYPIAYSYTESANFNSASNNTTTLTVNPASVSFAITNNTHTYDGTAKGVTVTPTPSGVAYTVTYSQNGQTVTSPTNAGIYDVNVVSADANYQGSASGKLTINKVSTTLRSADVTITYGQDATVSATLDPALSGRTISFTIGTTTLTGTTNASGAASATFSGLAANTAGHEVTIRFAEETNYLGSSASAKVVVNKANPVITWSNPAAVPQGTALSGTQLNATASVPGTFTYSPAAGTVLHTVGSHILSVDFAPTDATNYNSVLGTTVTIQVTNVAPTVTITAPPSGSIYQKGTNVTFTASITDPGVNDSHTATWTFKREGATDRVETASITPNGSGTWSISNTFSFSTPGVYNITLTVINGDKTVPVNVINGDPQAPAMIVVYDPDGGFVTGGGWINSPAGAFTANPSLTGRANFGFVSRYQRGTSVPTGETQFQFQAGNLNFHSTSYEWLTIDQFRAQYKGKGRLNGVDGFDFVLTAIDGHIQGGGGVDKFRIRIKDSSGAVVYDNMGHLPETGSGSFEGTGIGGGSIQIQSK